MKFFKALLLLTPLYATPALAETKVDGLVTITPEWHAEIASGNCLNSTGFGPCTADADFTAAANGRHYQGPTEETSRLLTGFNIYSEECRGAVGLPNIEGWCAKRDDARDQLAENGVCLGDSGFFLCTTKAQGDLPIFGEWDCDGMKMVIDAKSYRGAPIRTIEENGGDFLVTLEDDYRFALFNVTATSFTWHSPQSGDTFECKKP